MSTQIPSNENLFQNFTRTGYTRGEIAMMPVDKIAKMVKAKRKKQPDQLPLDDWEIAERVRTAARGISFGPDLSKDQHLLTQLIELQWAVLEAQNEQIDQLKSIGTVTNLIGFLIILGIIGAIIQACMM